MNRKLVWKVTACGLAGVLTLGAFSFEAIATPSAGISSYTSNIVTSSAIPTAGLSLALSECVADIEEEAVLSSAQP